MIEELTTDRLREIAREARQVAEICDRRGYMDGRNAASQQAQALEEELSANE